MMRKFMTWLLIAIMTFALPAQGEELPTQEDTSSMPVQPVRNYSYLADVEVGRFVTFGSYEQDGDLSNGKEPISWIVLAREDNRLLVLSRNGLDCKPFHEESTNITWENCTLRAWLNNEFYHAAFSDKEKAMIPPSLILAEQNPSYPHSIPGNDTMDSVFLLSIQEAEKYCPRSLRDCEPTYYAKTQGSGKAREKYANWCLRSSGGKQKNAAYISAALIFDLGENVTWRSGYTVRPALWIDLTDILAAAAEKKAQEEAQEEAAIDPMLANRRPAAEPIPKDVAVGDFITFGAYEQDGDLTNGKESIEWLVLAREDNRLLVLSRYGLDCQQFHEEDTNITWESCTLRAWLNDEFFHTAFSAEEQDMIPTTLVLAEKNPSFDSIPGNDTWDKVFLLSIQEVKAYTPSPMVAELTVYAKKQGAKGNNNGRWWLRSTGGEQNLAANVNGSGILFARGYSVARTDHTVRPAIWVDLSASVASEEKPREESAAMPAEQTPAAASGFAAAAVGDIITFGAYEQDNNLANGKEPIEWLVLDKNSSGLLVISRYVLDDQPYHALEQSVTWETCYLRIWLNGHFMNEAFTADERAQILTTTVKAEANVSAYPWTYAGNNTKDQLFLLSYSQAHKYFPGEGDSNCEPTAYAEAQGAIVPAHNRVFSRYSKNVTSTIWWLRTVGSSQDNACHVLASGGPSVGGNAVENTAGVRPAMWISLAP